MGQDNWTQLGNYLLYIIVIRASIDILPEVVQVLKHSKVEIYIDGGIRYGSDIFKCLALGANHVFLGRPVIFSTTVG
jgi:(S)-2-hydroxy-acid oxidase